MSRSGASSGAASSAAQPNAPQVQAECPTAHVDKDANPKRCKQIDLTEAFRRNQAAHKASFLPGLCTDLAAELELLVYKDLRQNAVKWGFSRAGSTLTPQASRKKVDLLAFCLARLEAARADKSLQAKTAGCASTLQASECLHAWLENRSAARGVANDLRRPPLMEKPFSESPSFAHQVIRQVRAFFMDHNRLPGERSPDQTDTWEQTLQKRIRSLRLMRCRALTHLDIELCRLWNKMPFWSWHPEPLSSFYVPSRTHDDSVTL